MPRTPSTTRRTGVSPTTPAPDPGPSRTKDTAEVAAARGSRARDRLPGLLPVSGKMKAHAVLGVNMGTGKEFESMQVRSYAIHELRNSAKTAATAPADKTRPVSQKKQDFLAKYDPAAEIARTPVEILFKVATHYDGKHGIDIYFSGRHAGHGRTGERAGEPLPALSPAEAAEHMMALRDEARRTGRCIGFIHPNKQVGWTIEGVNEGPAHSDAYIVTPFGSIVNLLDIGHMLSCELTGNELMSGGADLLTCSLSRFLEPTPEQRLGQHRMLTGQQAEGARGCGSLALVNLKEYLKKDGDEFAAQLLHRTLVLRLPQDGEHAKADFMLPSPLAVRYSQSSLYLRLLRAMVESEEDEVVVESDRGPRRIKTLAGLLRAGATCSAIDGSDIEDLQAFRTEWLRVFDEEALPRRDNLNHTSNEGTPQESTINVYLASVIDRHMKIAGYTPPASVPPSDSDVSESEADVPAGSESGDEADSPRAPAAAPARPAGGRRFVLGGDSSSDDDSSS